MACNLSVDIGADSRDKSRLMNVKRREREGMFRYPMFVVLALLVTTSMIATAYSGQFEDAVAAYKRRDYTTAFRLMKPLADKGNANAQTNLGFMYFSGQGIPKNYAEAVKWYRRSAEQGHATAQFNLGLMYANGQGVPQDYAEAMKWYQKAAQQGYADAQSNIGFMYDHGRGVPQDYAEAVKWYRRAAEQGYATAQFNLGVMYKAGKGVPQNYVLAHLWFNLAAWRFPESKRKDREDAETLRDLVALKMTPTQIAEAQRLAREWRPKQEVR
jgi:uncharacterized protein